METISMEKMEKPMSNSPFSPFMPLAPPLLASPGNAISEAGALDMGGTYRE